MVDALRSRGVDAYEWIGIFPPTRTQTQEEVERTLHAGAFDGVLIIGVADSGVQQTATVSDTTNYAYGSTTTTRPVNKPYADFDTKIVDIATGRTAWIGEAFTGGNGYANFDTVVGSFCDSTAAELVKQGVVAHNIGATPLGTPNPVQPKPLDPDPCDEKAGRAKKTEEAAERAHSYSSQTCRQQGDSSPACSSAVIAEKQQRATATEDAASLERCRTKMAP